MNSTRSSHFHEWALTVIFRADDDGLRPRFKEIILCMKILRLVLRCNRLASHRVIIRDAQQLYAFQMAQVGDIGLAMMMGKRKNTDPDHEAAARGCNFTGRPLWADSRAASAI